jgi:uncharacterized membrane protein (DUF441 family)
VAPAALFAPISEGSAGTAQLSAAVAASHPSFRPFLGMLGAVLSGAGVNSTSEGAQAHLTILSKRRCTRALPQHLVYTRQC